MSSTQGKNCDGIAVAIKQLPNAVTCLHAIRAVDAELDGRPVRFRCRRMPALDARLQSRLQAPDHVRHVLNGDSAPQSGAGGTSWLKSFRVPASGSNRTYRHEVLNLYLFRNLDEVREVTSAWIEQYNECRPHDALGGLPPVPYHQKRLENSTFEPST